MTFKLADPEATYRTIVQVEVPADGGPQTQEFTAVFRLVPPEEIDELAKKTGPEYDRAFLHASLKGWEDVAGADGQPLPYTPENVDLLARIPYLVRAVDRAYFRFSQGLPGKTSAQRGDTGASGPQAATTH